MRKRVLVLPIAAAIIATLCAYRLLREERPLAGVDASSALKRPAPPFELFNSESPPKPVRLKSYLGRHRIILVFFDSRLGADRDPRLLRLAEFAKQIDDADIKVFGISGALPPQNRDAVERLSARQVAVPFVLLTDPPPTEGAPEMGDLVHKEWGRYDETAGRSLPGVFLVDRGGLVEWNAQGPVPMELDDMMDAIDVKQTSGRWVVLGMFAFAATATGLLYVYWHLHTAPFRPLQEALAQEFAGSHPRVEGGQEKMHKGTPRILRVTLQVQFDPNDTNQQTAGDELVDRIVELAGAYHNLSNYDTLEIYLARRRQIRLAGQRPEDDTQVRAITRDLSQIDGGRGAETRPAGGAAQSSPAAD